MNCWHANKKGFQSQIRSYCKLLCPRKVTKPLGMTNTLRSLWWRNLYNFIWFRVSKASLITDLPSSPLHPCLRSTQHSQSSEPHNTPSLQNAVRDTLTAHEAWVYTHTWFCRIWFDSSKLICSHELPTGCFQRNCTFDLAQGLPCCFFKKKKSVSADRYTDNP